MKFRGILVFTVSFFLPACAGKLGTAPSVPTTDVFEVPASIADQFAVKESVSPSTTSTSPPLVAAPLVVEKKKHGKKDQNKDPKSSASALPQEPSKPNLFPNRWTMPPFLKAGERTVFDITYFGATAGQLELNVLPSKVVANRLSYHFRAVATSTSVFSLFYRVNDVAESFMDTEGLFSHKYSLKLDESRQRRDVLELYDYRKKKAYYWSKWEIQDKEPRNEQSEIPMDSFTQDGLSSFFYVRTLPMEQGKSYEFPVVNNGKLRVVRVTVIAREELNTRIGTFPAIKLKPEVVLDGILQNNGDSFLWISDDPQRRLLKMDAKIRVGSVIAYLREHSYGDQPESK
jgi:hypothetical protein